MNEIITESVTISSFNPLIFKLDVSLTSANRGIILSSLVIIKGLGSE